MTSSFLYPSVECVGQHFYMTLNMNIHILYNICPILGSYINVAGSVAKHFQQHFFMTLKMNKHILYNVCPILGSYKSVAQNFQSVMQHSCLKNSISLRSRDPDWRRALTDRPARHIFFSFLVIFQLRFLILIPTEGERWPTDLLGTFFFLF